MHPELVIEKLNDFVKIVESDVVELKRISKIFTIMNLSMKIPIVILTSVSVLLSSVNISEKSFAILISVLVVNALLSILMPLYLYIAPETKKNNSNIALIHLKELINDVQISINELSINGIISALDSDSSDPLCIRTGGFRESHSSDKNMYNHYLITITRYSMKRVMILG